METSKNSTPGTVHCGIASENMSGGQFLDATRVHIFLLACGWKISSMQAQIIVQTTFCLSRSA
jgi:hypothetical protein